MRRLELNLSGRTLQQIAMTIIGNLTPLGCRKPESLAPHLLSTCQKARKEKQLAGLFLSAI